MKKLISLLLSVCMLCSLYVPAALADSETLILLQDDAIEISGAGASAQGSIVTISAAGVYVFSGTLTNGRIVVDAGKDDKVTLILRGADVTSADGPALMLSKAKKATLTLGNGDVPNRLVSGTPVTLDGSAEPAEDASGAALHAKCDLTIKGEGSLFVGGYLYQGIRAAKDLHIDGGQLAIEAIGTGIRCKDKLELTGGMIGIVSGGDGIHAASEATETAEADGYLLMTGGMLTITAQGDALQSETTMTIEGGELRAVTGGGASAAPAHTNDFDFGWRRGPWETDETEAAAEDDSATSCKGIKSAGDMVISGGELTLDTCDDGLCARGDMIINGGSVQIISGDDGIHADHQLTITSGSVAVAQSWEGLEALSITITGGEISITASDDGINATDGSGEDLWSFGGHGRGNRDHADGGRMPPMNDMQPGSNPPEMSGGDFTPPEMPDTQPRLDSESNAFLMISGGTLLVNAGGDGLDSNGSLLISGGTVIVDGPDNSGNGALDSGSENGGYLRVTGGTVLAIGAAGMDETFDSSSAQAVLNARISWQPGDELVIRSANGTELIRHTAVRSGQSIVFSSPELTDGDVLTIEAGSNTTEATVGQSASQPGGFGRNGFGHGGR